MASRSTRSSSPSEGLRRWMAGSDTFQRSRDFDGSDETELGELVHVAIVYHEDGQIVCYRNVRRMKPYQPTSPIKFAAGASQVVLGMRHGTAGGRRGQFRGSIERAQFYDRALTADESQASAASANLVTRAQVLAAMSPEERATHEQLTDEITRLEAELAAIPGAEQASDVTERAWQRFSLSRVAKCQAVHLRAVTPPRTATNNFMQANTQVAIDESNTAHPSPDARTDFHGLRHARAYGHVIWRGAAPRRRLRVFRRLFNIPNV